MTVLLAGMCSFVYAQTTYEWEKAPKPNEIEIGIITRTGKGEKTHYYDNCTYWRKELRGGSRVEGNTPTIEKLYEALLNKAKNEYGETNPNFMLRKFKAIRREEIEYYDKKHVCYEYFDCSALVVIPDAAFEANEHLSKAINKALENIREGSRLALDQIKIANGDKDDYKDQIVSILLDEGYKVVAKDYLEKLLEEQEQQQSGVYNSKTTVKENNLSAIGYYINVKQTETAIKVQVINVSTGEYEANVTENL